VDRRNFMRSLIGGVAATAAVRTWPFRVFSFAPEVKVFTLEYLNQAMGRIDMLDLSRWGRFEFEPLTFYMNADQERAWLEIFKIHRTVIDLTVERAPIATYSDIDRLAIPSVPWSLRGRPDKFRS
jgi:hypothetical protein